MLVAHTKRARNNETIYSQVSRLNTLEDLLGKLHVGMRSPYDSYVLLCPDDNYVITFSLYISVSLNESSMNIVELSNSEDPDKVAHNEMPHMDLHSWPSII